MFNEFHNLDLFASIFTHSLYLSPYNSMWMSKLYGDDYEIHSSSLIFYIFQSSCTIY